MISSILDSVKKILGIDYSYTAFDHDIAVHINAVFSTLDQLGIGPPGGFFIEDSNSDWTDFQTDSETEVVYVPNNQLHLIKSYMYLKVRMMFDPPTTSYLVDSMQRQIDQMEFRLSVFRENEIPYVPTNPILSEEVVI